MISCLTALAEWRSTPLRAVIMLSPHLPGWAKQRPEIFATRLVTPAMVVWCPGDELINGGPVEIGKLWAAESVTLRQHSGPGHRPLPADNSDRNTLIREVVEHIIRCCPQ
eukprot:CAMPEP_0183344334 /NCGR_PEP_ID=MMETSP0164_2-20130417/10043_1 /TAXON_ID=221442 /ORGANISM="Coccolithus pelagicus ssp braarudi, Strain PLY182g" /LENGTH=109 /DNA_ID=CAMNT_0025515321 /DNA_START=409 /DNA_END=738 /DNA_ORIENTATION=+